jgi:hypothetical protein
MNEDMTRAVISYVLRTVGLEDPQDTEEFKEYVKARLTSALDVVFHDAGYVFAVVCKAWPENHEFPTGLDVDILMVDGRSLDTWRIKAVSRGDEPTVKVGCLMPQQRNEELM